MLALPSFDHIPILPSIPEPLRLAARGGQLVPFIGAGVSQLAGCPGWEEFANHALNFFVLSGKLDHAQYDQISRLSPKIKLSLALDLERQHGISIDFRKLLESNEAKRHHGERVYVGLSQLATTFVTTNYDEWLDNISSTHPTSISGTSSAITTTSRSSIFRLPEIRVQALDLKNSVIHIHGSVRDKESMVLTTRHYLERYSSHRPDGGSAGENAFLTFLEQLFKLKSVLFIGYGLNELEVLEYIIQKASDVKPMDTIKEVPRHYVVQGFFSHEAEVARSLDTYYRQFGIGLMPFSRDKNDRLQLIEVIEYLSQEIPAQPQLPSFRRKEMEELLL